MGNHWEVVHKGDMDASTAEKLWLCAVNYFIWCDKNPIVNTKTIMTGKEAGRHVDEKSVRPYNVKAMCLHCGLSEEWIRDTRQSKDKGSEWYIVVSKILYIIAVQNQEMATVGAYNAIFISRLLNMDRDELPTSAVKIEIIGGTPTLSKSENDILEKLELENKSSAKIRPDNPIEQS